MRAPESEAGWDWPRLTLGVLPPLLAWVALLLPPYWTALLLILGLMLTVIVESWAARVHAVAPRSWLRLRWLLSIGASSSLFFGVLLLL